MKRPLSLTAYTIGVVTNMFGLLINLLTCIVFGVGFRELDKAGVNPTGLQIAYFCLICINFLILLGAIIVNSISIASSRAPSKKFERRKELFVISICLNIIEILYIVAFSIIYLFLLMNGNGEAIIEWGVCFIGLIVSIILAIYDFSNEKYRKNGNKQEIIDNQYESEQVVYSNIVYEEDKRKVAGSSLSLEKELAKLNDMKMAGLINEDDFNIMKAALISKLYK